MNSPSDPVDIANRPAARLRRALSIALVIGVGTGMIWMQQGIAEAQTVAPPSRIDSTPLPPPPQSDAASPAAPPSVVAPPKADPAPLSPLSPTGAVGRPEAPAIAVPQRPAESLPPGGQAPAPLNPLPSQSGSAPIAPQPAPPPAPPAGIGAVSPPGLPQPGGQSPPPVAPRDFASEADLAELVIEQRPVLILPGDAANEDGFATLLAAFKRLNEEARKAGVVVLGRPFAVIDLTDEKRYKFEAMLPVENTATTPPVPGLKFGQSPSGQAIRFKYGGAYEDNTYVYESIEAYIEERGISARPYAIEEFLTDPVDSSDASLQMFIYYLKE